MQPMKKVEDYAARISSIEKELRLILEGQNTSTFELPKLDYDRIESDLNSLIEEIQSHPATLKQELEPVLACLRTTVEEGRNVILKHMESIKPNIDNADVNKKAIHAYTKSMVRPSDF